MNKQESARDVRQLIDGLALEPHPEGGWYRETYRAAESIAATALPARFSGARSISTAIYFLLAKGEISALHRIKSDELWHFYSGTTLTVHLFFPTGEYRQIRLGADIAGGETFQATVPAGCWFGAEVTGEGAYSLVGCTVAPGFDFVDFEMGTRAELVTAFPGHKELIRQLTRA